MDDDAYNPDLADSTQMPGSEGGAQGDDSMDALPPPTEDQGSRKEEANWWRSIMDAARQQFGIGDVNANAPAEGAEPAGLPQQADGEEPSQPDEAEPAGLPAQAGDDSASFDRKTGTAGGMRTRPNQPNMGGPDAGPDWDRLSKIGGAVTKTGEFLFGDRPPTGPEDPEAAGYGGKGVIGNAAEALGENVKQGPAARIIQYLTGHGGEDAAATKAREQEVEAKLPPGTGKDEVRAEALKQNAAKNGNAAEGVLAQWQAYKGQYNKFKTLAAVAQDHGDNEGAAQLFNEAHTYLPNGIKVTASPGSSGGMTIHISDPTGGNFPPAEDIKLTGDQFRELTHMRAGEFDHVLERGIANNLRDLAKTPGMSEAPGQQAAQPQAQPQAQPSTAKPSPRDNQSPEARAQRAYPWVSQGQKRELTAEHYRQTDRKDATAAKKEENTGRALDIREKLGDRGMDIRAGESERKRDYGNENLRLKGEAIAQRDRHLGYLIDKSTGELNEKMLTHLEQTNGRNASNFVRYMDAKIRAGDTLTDQEKQSLDQVRQKAMTPASRPSTLNGGTRAPAAPPVSGRGTPPIGKNGLPMVWRE